MFTAGIYRYTLYHTYYFANISERWRVTQKLSSLIAPDPEFAIYRNFVALNAQKVFYQAELMDLESDLHEIATEDRCSQDSEKRLFAENWYELSHAEPGKYLQYRKGMQLRKVLMEYDEHPVQSKLIV